MAITRILILILIALCVYSVSGQYGYCPFPYSTGCATCLSNPSCFYNSGCGGGICTSFSTVCAGSGTSFSSAALCPTVPTAAEAARPLSSAYGLLGLAAFAVSFTAVAAYSNVEQSCCTKEKTPPRAALGINHHLLFLSSCFLWFGLSLGLAAPALPWLVAVFPTSTLSANAFFVHTCNFDTSTKEYSLCSHKTLLQYLYGEQEAQAYAQSGLALGVVAYVVLIGFLFPSAVITSVAMYRFSKSTKQGTPAYTSGCSPASLFVAQLLGWPSFAAFAIVSFIAISICSAAAIKARIGAEFAGMPGIVAALVSITLLLLGLVLQCIVARALKDVRGVGCNSGGCCCAESKGCLHVPPGGATVITSPLASVAAPQVMALQPHFMAPQPQVGAWVRQTDGKECVLAPQRSAGQGKHCASLHAHRTHLTATPFPAAPGFSTWAQRRRRGSFRPEQ